MDKPQVHILLVEDEEAHVELIRRAFESHAAHARLTLAQSLAEARSFLAQGPSTPGRPPDLVIADLLLPDGHGTQLLPSDGESPPFPLVVMTSHGDEQVAVDAMRAGALDYVVNSEAALADMPRVAERALREWAHITERARAEEETRRRNRELALLNRVIAAATSTLDPDQVLQTVCRELTDAFSLPGVAAVVLAEGQDEASVVAEHIRLPRSSTLGYTFRIPGNSAAEYVLAHKAPLAAVDAQTDERLAPVHDMLRRRDICSLLVAPIVVARGRVIGGLILATLQRRAFSQEEIALAQNAAAAAGQALETARLYEALQQQAEQLEKTVAQRTAELQVALLQAQDADRLKSEFVSNVSHELRTPLNNIKLFLSLLTRGRPEKREAYMETLHREATRLQVLIEGLLDLSRLDLGRMQAVLQPTDVNLLVGTLATDRGALVADRGLSLDVGLSEALPQALADPKLLDQVLTNLLTNAISYTPPGGEVSLLTGLVEAQPRRWITISVADTGPGIPKEERASLFQRFFRGTAGRNSDAAGTGLGLAICREIVGLHGGRITVESEGVPGQGSVFTVWLQVAPYEG